MIPDPLTREGSLSTSPSDSLDSALGGADRQAELFAGELLGQFRVEGRIGRGGRGTVYRAYDVKLKRMVALKVLAEGAARVERLLAEARSAAALTHASIAAVYDVQQVDGVAFLVMELVEGVTLRQHLSGGALPVDRALPIARDLAAAIARAHRCSIVHRDLKPENVVVTPEGHAKVLDFGLARTMMPGGPSPALEGVTGTRDYMSPEQAAGKGSDARTDVFSFGIILYEMIAGARPFAPRAERDVTRWGPEAYRIPRALRELAPRVPPALERIVDRCLELDPERRFADGSVLETAVAAVRSPPPSRRGLLALAAVALVASAVPFAWRLHGQRPRLPPARRLIAAAGQTWEVVDGDWSADGDALVGRAGHVQTRSDVSDAVVTVEVEMPATPRTMVGIGFRYGLRDDDARNQCGYGFNFSSKRLSGSFVGDDGEWGPVSNGLEPSTALRPGWNTITVRMSGASFEVDVNGQRADAFEDARWPRGRVNLWAQNGEVRVRQVRVAPL